MRTRLSAASWPILASLAALLPLAPAFSSSTTLSWRDSAQLHAPVRELVAPALRALRLPLWNPFEGTGQPLLAQWLHAVLHPVTITTALLRLGMDAWLMGLVAFAASGAWVASRSLGCSRPAAAGAAWGYALSGYVLGMTCNATYLAGAASAPWVVAGMVLAAERGGAAVVFGAATIATALFAGDPQAVATSLLAGGALAITRSGRRALARGGASVVLGTGLAAIQLLPSVAYLGTTVRWAGALQAAELHQWPLDPPRLIELVAPGFFVGRPTQWEAPVFQALGTASPYPFPWAPSVFVGLTLILLAAASHRSRAGRVLLALAGLFCFLALGHHLGAQQLLQRVPVWGSFRYAEKLVAPLSLCLALAAGLGIDAALEARRLPAAATGFAASFLVLGLALFLAPRWFESIMAVAGAPADAARLARSHLFEGSAHAALGAAALAALLRLGPSEPGRAASALAGLVFLQSAAASPFALHFGDTRAVSACPPGLVAEPPGPRVLTAVVHNVREAADGLDAIDGLLRNLGRLGVPSNNVACRVDAMEGYTGFETRRAELTIWDPSRRLELARRLGATHVTSEPPRGADEVQTLARAIEGGRPVALSGVLGVWAVPHRPWASLAEAVILAAGPEQAADALRSDPRPGAVVIEAPAMPATSPGRVLSVRREAERIEVEAEASDAALLVVNDAWAPGWKATIDGAPATIHPADVLVRAVQIPAGRHRVVMRYAPSEVIVGGWISFLTALGCALTILARRLRRAGVSGPSQQA